MRADQTCRGERARWTGKCLVFHSQTAFSVPGQADFYHFPGSSKPWLVAPKDVERTTLPRYHDGLRNWHRLFNDLRIPHGDGFLRASDLPKLLQMPTRKNERHKPGAWSSFLGTNSSHRKKMRHIEEGD